LSDLPKSALGRIDMKEMNSWVEVDKKVANQMIKSVDGKNYRGRKIRMNDANSR
jgi:ATP-dependent RNA helicase DeaD